MVGTWNLQKVSTGRHALKRIIDGVCNRTFAVASQLPALVRKTIEAIVTENEMVEEPDAQ